MIGCAFALLAFCMCECDYYQYICVTQPIMCMCMSRYAYKLINQTRNCDYR